MNVLRTRRNRDEQGMETVAMLFVIPVLIVLVLALIDVGMMFRARMLVENVARDAVRGVAADGGNMNPRTNTMDGKQWDTWAMERFLDEGGNCEIAPCLDNRKPSIDCTYITPPGGGEQHGSNEVKRAGYTVTCKGHYPYEPINAALLNSPMGLGMGQLLKEFEIEVSARAETGNESAFG